MGDWKLRTEQVSYNRKVWLKRAYGLTPEDIQKLYEDQKGQCAVCQDALGEGKNCHIDHDHITDKVRGLLCRHCNVGLGCFSDSVGRLAAAIEYLGLTSE